MPCHCGRGAIVIVIFRNLSPPLISTLFLGVSLEGYPYARVFCTRHPTFIPYDVRPSEYPELPTFVFGKGKSRGMRVERTRVRHPRVRNNNN